MFDSCEDLVISANAGIQTRQRRDVRFVARAGRLDPGFRRGDAMWLPANRPKILALSETVTTSRSQVAFIAANFVLTWNPFLDFSVWPEYISFIPIKSHGTARPDLSRHLRGRANEPL